MKIHLAMNNRRALCRRKAAKVTHKLTDVTCKACLKKLRKERS